MSMMNLRVSVGLNFVMCLVNLPYSIILRSRMSLTRQIRRLIYEMTVKIMLRCAYSTDIISKLCISIREDERGVLNSWETVN